MKYFKTQRDIENLHIFLWLMKDNAWCHDWHWVGVFFILPTLGVQLYLTWRVRKDIHEVFHAVAVAIWIAANSIWMIGEFFFDDTWRTVPGIMFGLGLLCVALYYGMDFLRDRRTKAAIKSVESLISE